MTQRVYCSVPNCDKTIAANNTSDVCRNHRHKRPYCRCVDCLRAEKGIPLDRKITLPQPPWEQLT